MDCVTFRISCFSGRRDGTQLEDGGRELVHLVRLEIEHVSDTGEEHRHLIGGDTGGHRESDHSVGESYQLLVGDTGLRGQLTDFREFLEGDRKLRGELLELLTHLAAPALPVCWVTRRDLGESRLVRDRRRNSR